MVEVTMICHSGFHIRKLKEPCQQVQQLQLQYINYKPWEISPQKVKQHAFKNIDFSFQPHLLHLLATHPNHFHCLEIGLIHILLQLLLQTEMIEIYIVINVIYLCKNNRDLKRSKFKNPENRSLC